MLDALGLPKLAPALLKLPGASMTVAPTRGLVNDAALAHQQMEGRARSRTGHAKPLQGNRVTIPPPAHGWIKL